MVERRGRPRRRLNRSCLAEATRAGDEFRSADVGARPSRGPCAVGVPCSGRRADCANVRPATTWCWWLARPFVTTCRAAQKARTCPRARGWRCSPTILRPRRPCRKASACWAASAWRWRDLLQDLLQRPCRAGVAPRAARGFGDGSAQHGVRAAGAGALCAAPTDIVVEEAPTARPWMQRSTADDAARHFLHHGQRRPGLRACRRPWASRWRNAIRVIALIGDGSSVQHPEPLERRAARAGRHLRGAEQRWLRAAMKRHAGLLGFAPGEKVVGIAVPGILRPARDRAKVARRRVTDAQGLHAVLEAVCWRARAAAWSRW